ncbi:hypothetical protein HUJ04_007144 [Dendroctonus ponderosae]|nr:hypothetical protein HUJ04_007144 [Dendroctonus ponderosae]
MSLRGIQFQEGRNFRTLLHEDTFTRQQLLGYWFNIEPYGTSHNQFRQRLQIQSGNKCLYALRSVLASKDISRRTKITIYKTIIRPTVMYAGETWTLAKDNERKLRFFERNVLLKNFGPLRSTVTSIPSNNQSGNIRIIQRSRYCEGDKDTKAAMGGSCTKAACNTADKIDLGRNTNGTKTFRSPPKEVA